MTLVHKGIRPKYELVHKTNELKAIKGIDYEIYPNGAYRVWTKRMLTSGCDCSIHDIHKLDDLIYCPHCDEFFSVDQFEEIK